MQHNNKIISALKDKADENKNNASKHDFLFFVGLVRYAIIVQRTFGCLVIVK